MVMNLKRVMNVSNLKKCLTSYLNKAAHTCTNVPSCMLPFTPAAS